MAYNLDIHSIDAEEGIPSAIALARDPQTSTEDLEAMYEQLDADWRATDVEVALASALAENPSATPDMLLALAQIVPSAVGSNLALPILCVENPSFPSDLMAEIFDADWLSIPQTYDYIRELVVAPQMRPLYPPLEEYERSDAKAGTYILAVKRMLPVRMMRFSNGWMVECENSLFLPSDVYSLGPYEETTRRIEMEGYDALTEPDFWALYRKVELPQQKAVIGAVAFDWESREGMKQALSAAENPETPTEELEVLYEQLDHLWDESDAQLALAMALAQNPAATPAMLLELVQIVPISVGSNPVLPLLCIEDPLLPEELLGAIMGAEWLTIPLTYNLIRDLVLARQMRQIYPPLEEYERVESITDLYAKAVSYNFCLRAIRFRNGWMMQYENSLYLPNEDYQVDPYQEAMRRLEQQKLVPLTEEQFWALYRKVELPPQEKIGSLVPSVVGAGLNLSEAIQKAQNLQTPTEDMLSLWQVLDENLGDLAWGIWFDGAYDSDQKDWYLLAIALAQNPASPPSILCPLSLLLPVEVGSNQVLPLLLVENPSFLRDCLDQILTDEEESFYVYQRMLLFMKAPEVAKLDPHLARYDSTLDPMDFGYGIPTTMDEFASGLVLVLEVDGVGYSDNMQAVFNGIKDISRPEHDSLPHPTLASFLLRYTKTTFEVPASVGRVFVGPSEWGPELLRPKDKVRFIGAETGIVHPEGISVFHSNNGYVRLVYCRQGKVQAALTLTQKGPKGHYEIHLVYTTPSARRKGYASQLLQHARKIFTSVVHSADLSQDGRAWSSAVGAVAGRRRPDREVDEIMNNPQASAEVLRLLGPEDRLRHPNCPMEDWWKYLPLHPYAALTGPAAGLFLLEDPGRFDEMKQSRLYSLPFPWIVDTAQMHLKRQEQIRFWLDVMRQVIDKVAPEGELRDRWLRFYQYKEARELKQLIPSALEREAREELERQRAMPFADWIESIELGFESLMLTPFDLNNISRDIPGKAVVLLGMENGQQTLDWLWNLLVEHIDAAEDP